MAVTVKERQFQAQIDGMSRSAALTLALRRHFGLESEQLHTLPQPLNNGPGPP